MFMQVSTAHSLELEGKHVLVLHTWIPQESHTAAGSLKSRNITYAANGFNIAMH